MELLEFLQGLNIFFQLLIALAFGLYLVGFYFLLSTKYKRIQKRKEDFYNKLNEGLKIGTITSMEDIFNIYKGINDYNLPNDRYRNNINTLLRAFIVKLHDNSDQKHKDEDLLKWKNTISDYIKQNEEASPFADLPDAERNIMNDILMYLENDNKVGIKSKTKELAAYIQSKSERITDLEKKYKSSNITAVVGIILTIIFGIASIVISF
jgi:hypothetical protein